MTDQELDQLMRRVLIEALRLDADAVSEAEIPFKPSGPYRHSMRSMRKNPLKWRRNREMPLWRRVLKQAAVILLVLSIGFGAMFVMVPSIRAAVIDWFIEWYETYIVYRYGEEVAPEQLPEYEITALPDGFMEKRRTVVFSLVSVTYEDKSGNMIMLEYAIIQQGGATAFFDDDTAASDITVKGVDGLYFESEISGGFSTVTWVDEDQNIHFSVSGTFELAELLKMAESVS